MVVSLFPLGWGLTRHAAQDGAGVVWVRRYWLPCYRWDVCFRQIIWDAREQMMLAPQSLSLWYWKNSGALDGFRIP